MARSISIGLVAFVALLASAANAQVVHPKLLTETLDVVDGGQDVQSYINDDATLSAGVGLLDITEAPVGYGDQLTARTFTATGVVGMEIHWQSAAFAPRHRIGWYPVSDPNAITWVIGGAGTGLGSAGLAAPGGHFGLVLDAGNKGLNLNSGNDAGNNYFYSQPELNGDTPLSHPLPSLNGFDRRDHVAVFQNQQVSGELILAWEDYKNTTPQRYLDYNDLGMTLSSAEPVPEPIGLSALALGLVGLWGRSRRRR